MNLDDLNVVATGIFQEEYPDTFKLAEQALKDDIDQLDVRLVREMTASQLFATAWGMGVRRAAADPQLAQALIAASGYLMQRFKIGATD